ncbi:MAG TPA: 1-(5-phosphoribosyl)-5-[(5-phosphoribosylamino)methylideneamino] imidazole-4-carboxamide isomerase [Gemmatimonadaceae bacterium]
MIAIPAVDLRDGACVQLVGGSYDDERIRLSDPVRVARCWAEIGFRRLHVVDLDAATGAGSNAGLIDAIVREVDAEVQVGGGVRSATRIEELVTSGAARVVTGTRALADRDWIVEQATRFPGSLVVAVDVRDGRVATHGWTTSIDRAIDECLADLSDLPLAGVFVTAVDVEGQMQGPDVALMKAVTAAARVPVIASGGIASLADLRLLADLGISAAVIGMALYTGRLDAHAVAKEFGA